MDWLRRVLGLQPVEGPTTQAEDTIKSEASQSEAPAKTTPDKIVEELPEDIAAAEQTASKEDFGPIAGSETVIPPPDNDGRTRQLPPLESVIPAEGAGNIRLSYGQRSDVGQVRDTNQDSMLSFTSSMTVVEDDPNFGLFVVADGMGGHEHGEKASAVAAQMIARNVINDIFMSLLNGETGGDAERPTIIEVLRTSVQKANEVVSEQIPDGGTTVTAAAIMGHSAYIAHVGDSRAYLITQDLIEQITRDHSLVQRLIELDQLTPEDALEHPQRNILYRALGQNETLDVDAIIRQIPHNGYLLLCSDGLWNLVSKEEIHQIVLENHDNPQGACETLVTLANDRGGPDNITVILVRFPG